MIFLTPREEEALKLLRSFPIAELHGPVLERLIGRGLVQRKGDELIVTDTGIGALRDQDKINR